MRRCGFKKKTRRTPIVRGNSIQENVKSVAIWQFGSTGSTDIRYRNCELKKVTNDPKPSTLNNDMRGTDHIESEEQVTEQRKKIGECNADDNQSQSGYKAMEIAKDQNADAMLHTRTKDDAIPGRSPVTPAGGSRLWCAAPRSPPGVRTSWPGPSGASSETESAAS